VAKAAGTVQETIVSRIVQPIQQYLRDTRAELRKVTWPTRKEAWNLTLIVLAATVGMAIVLGAADFLFSKIMTMLVLRVGIGFVAAVVGVAGGVAAWYFIQREE
jgi:preprotein translocase subunit SecE